MGGQRVGRNKVAIPTRTQASPTLGNAHYWNLRVLMWQLTVDVESGKKNNSKCPMTQDFTLQACFFQSWMIYHEKYKNNNV